MPDSVQLRPGDVVFRRGSGLLSQAVMRADGKGIYTHTGIVVDSCGELMIVHAVPGEPDYVGDPDRVKMERPEQFFCSDRAVCGEVRRLQDSVSAARAAQVALWICRKGTLFDHTYDLHDTTSMYCTELVVYSYSRAGFHLQARPRLTPFASSLVKCDSIFMPSDLMEAEQLRLLVKF